MSEEENKQDNNEITSLPIADLYEDWFLDYASYVILERAVPLIDDGLKPVQRRILHAMKEMDDGRYHKVANIIGQTMQYHPHGDASIGDALVNIGQKDLMIDCQGNWGDVRTGDRAAAPRYIEARLTKFALDVGFHQHLTEWQLSYDGRKKEPIALPIKFPLLLEQGVEGIAVGLSTKILPHNFIELCKASIDILKDKKPKLYPDFATGGMIDVNDYNDGERGGKVKVRAKIEVVDKNNLIITEIPYGTTTGSLIDSIIKANDKGKIKIKKVVDNTAEHVEIAIELASGVSPEVTVDALYAFTSCESSISINACVIVDNKPRFLSVLDILRISTEKTKELLKRELEYELNQLEQQWHFSSLEKIFIENRIYRDIEECETWEAVIEAIDKGLDPFKKLLKREVTTEDIVKLTEIKIKRISKFDSFKADELIKGLEEKIAEVKDKLAHLNDYAIAHFERLMEKYGKGKERKTEIKLFDTIEVKMVAVANKKLHVNREEGFIGYNLRDAETVGPCSDIDDIIVFRKDGVMLVTRIEEKKFVGKDILFVDVWKKDDERRIYHMIYADAKSKRNYMKRFAVTSITRDKEYLLTASPNSKVIYFSCQPNSEAEVVSVQLSSGSKAKIKQFDYDFAELAIKGRNSQGNILTKYPIRRVDFKTLGESTLGGVKIWLDPSIGRLNKDERGMFLGEFDTGDLIAIIFKDGSYELTDFDLVNRYDMEQIYLVSKFHPEQIYTIVYKDGDSANEYVKRFKIETTTTQKRFSFIGEHKKSQLLYLSNKRNPVVEFTVLKGKTKEKEINQINLEEFIDVKGWKAMGNRLAYFPLQGKLKELSADEVIFEKPVNNTRQTDLLELVDEEEDVKPEEKEPEKELEPMKEKEVMEPIQEKTDEPQSEEFEIGDTIEFDIKKNESKKQDKKEPPIQGELF